ncbi:MAG: hypothetical protein HY683_09450 [Chloroflexi bacterium]|nr:hypothetical protein [Chloroflexota bacterium]
MEGYRGRRIAQRQFDDRHVLCVVFEEHADAIVVVTVYPARKERYAH